MTTVATLTQDSIATISLPYNPNETDWSYQLNRNVVDTYGGRVVQLLSVSTSSMNLSGDAGSRKNLLQLFSDLKKVQAAQISSQSSAVLNIPATFAENGAITQNVYIQTVNIGWDPRTVTYPYTIVLEVEDSTTYGNINENIMSTVINEITAQLGWTDGIGLSGSDGKLSLLYQGLEPSSALTVAQMSANIWNSAANNILNLSGVSKTGSYGI